MRRFKLEICYNGSKYSGWQIQKSQPGVRTIQGELESAILKITGEKVSVVGSGRTDAGVHALYQVAAFSSETRLSPETLARALNAELPIDVRVWNVSEVAESFHPIFDMIRKRYRYLFSDSRPVFPFFRPYLWQLLKPVELDAMQIAASYLRGTHDFRAFETQGSPRQSPIRTIFDIQIERRAALDVWDFPKRRDGILASESARSSTIVLEVEADGFLYNMVRAIAGTLAAFGQRRQGFEDPRRMETILASADRRLAGPTAPPCGLYMIDVVYDPTEIERRPIPFSEQDEK